MEKTLNEAAIEDLLGACDMMLEAVGEDCETDADWEFAAQLVVDFHSDEDGGELLGWRWSDWGGIEFTYGAI